MASKPMEQWEESELFGEGYLAKRTKQVVDEVVESASSPSAESEEAETMENRLPRPMSAHDAPPLWRCNARKEHCPEGIECRELIDKAPTISPCLCKRCMIEMYPYLEEGTPWIVNEKWRERLEADFVGLYEPEGYAKARPPCVKCGVVIKIDGKTASKFEQNDEEIIHVACLSDEDAQALHEIAGGAYALPYLIRKRQVAQEEECDGPEAEGEDSGSAG
jgi:hypothetical protein